MDVSPTNVLEFILSGQKVPPEDDSKMGRILDAAFEYNMIMSEPITDARARITQNLVEAVLPASMGDTLDFVLSKSLKWLDDGGSHHRMLALVSPEAATMKPLLDWNITVIASAGVGLGRKEKTTVDWWHYPLEAGYIGSWDENTFFVIGNEYRHIDVAYQYNSQDISDVDKGIRFMERHNQWRKAARERRMS